MTRMEWVVAGILIVLGSICLLISATSDPGQLQVIFTSWLVPFCILLCLFLVIVGIIYIVAKWKKKR